MGVLLIKLRNILWPWNKRHRQKIIPPHKPKVMIMLLNTGCNLTCKFCTLHTQNKQLSLDFAKRIISQAKGLGVKQLVLTGGEPLIYPHFYQVTKFAKDSGIDVIVTTNGTMIRPHLQRLLDSKINSINVSIDGNKATHDAIRGKAGAYEQAIDGIKLLIEKMPGTEVKVNFVVTRQNVMELVPTYKLMKEFGAKFDFWPVNDAPNMYITSEEDKKAYIDAIEYISDCEGSAFPGKKEYYTKALDYHAGKQMCTRCLGLKDSFGINVDGELVACCLWGDKGLAVGNANASSLGELWNSERAQELRHKIYTQGCIAKCYNHSLYEFAQKTGESFEVRRE